MNTTFVVAKAVAAPESVALVVFEKSLHITSTGLCDFSGADVVVLGEYNNEGTMLANKVTDEMPDAADGTRKVQRFGGDAKVAGRLNLF